MSSKLFRSEQFVDTSSVEWRAANGATVQTQRTRPAEAAMTSVPESRIAELQQEAEARAKSAYSQGLTAGENAAAHRAQQRIDPVLAGLNGVITELAGMRKRFRSEAEEDTVKLAVAIARRLIYRELAADPEAILGLVKAAFARVNARETHRLRVSPSDASAIQENRVRLQIPPLLEICSDNSLTPGSAIFETTRGDLDASVDTQLSEIERGFTDVLRRRAR